MRWQETSHLLPHEDQEVNDDSGDGVDCEQLEPLVVGEAAKPDQQDLADCLKSHGGPELSHADLDTMMNDGIMITRKTHRNICGDPPLETRGEGELGHSGDLRDVSEEHYQEPGLFDVLKLGTHESKHDQARN